MTVYISYDSKKDRELLYRRGVGFEEIKTIFSKPHYVEERGGDYIGQCLAIGIYKRKLWTLIFEDIEDDLGPLRWLITFWPSTPTERRKYHNA